MSIGFKSCRSHVILSPTPLANQDLLVIILQSQIGLHNLEGVSGKIASDPLNAEDSESRELVSSCQIFHRH